MSDLDYHLADGPCVGFHAVSGSASSDATGDLWQCRKRRFKQVSNAGPVYKTILNFWPRGLCQALQYLTICIKIFLYTVSCWVQVNNSAGPSLHRLAQTSLDVGETSVSSPLLGQKVGEGGAEPGLREGDVARDRAGGGRVRSARVHAGPTGS